MQYRHSDGVYRDYPENKIHIPIAHSKPENLIQPGLPNTFTIGVKHDAGKPRTELIPTEFIIEVAKALTFGANKYGDDNFRQGISYRRLLGAAKRHIELELARIETDSDSGHSHLAHAGASLAMYAFMKAHRPDLDDRYNYTEQEKKKIEEMMYGVKK